MGTAQQSQSAVMKTAIFLRGETRTWCLTKQAMLSFFSDIYPGCDWYVAFLNSDTITEAALKQDFAQQRLISAVLPDRSLYPLLTDNWAVSRWRYHNPAYWRIAWLDWLLSMRKRQHELDTGLRYDNVVFIRPDCWYFDGSAPYQRVTRPLGPMTVSEIGNSSTEGHLGDWYNGDLIWRAGSMAADIMALRYVDTVYTDGAQQLIHGNSHALLSFYQPRNYLLHDSDSAGFVSQLIRPDQADQLPWGPEKHDPNFNDSRTWHARSTADKIQWCQKLGIDPRDYQLVD